MNNNIPLVEAVSLKKYFKTPVGLLHAVDNISFRIHSGETLGVVGESGCGKSTLGRTILRLTEPTDGKILFDGLNVTNLKGRKLKEMRHNMQIIFQDPYSSIDPRKTVLDIISEFMLVNKTYPSRKDCFDRAAELMEIVGLASRLSSAYPHELDGGRRQRIGVARALSLNPRFIVCDEPVSALDVSIQAQILNLLMDLQEKYGLTYMFVSHDLSVVKHISQNIMVMYLGECVEMAPAEELFEHPAHPYTKALLSAIPSLDYTRRNLSKKLIRGEVSSPVDPKPGCRFALRCEYACDDCLRPQSLRTLQPGHLVACCRCAGTS